MCRTSPTELTFQLTSELLLAEFGVATVFGPALPEMASGHWRGLGREMAGGIVRRVKGSRGEEWKDYWG